MQCELSIRWFVYTKAGALQLHRPDGGAAAALEMSNHGRMLKLLVRDTEARRPQVADAHGRDRMVDFLHLLADGNNKRLKRFREAEADGLSQRQPLTAALSAEYLRSEDAVDARSTLIRVDARPSRQLPPIAGFTSIPAETARANPI